jgi:hypothetical protein
MINRPIFIIGCNRSGTTLLFRNLSMHPDLWSLYIESQDEFYRYWPIHPEFGDRLTQPPSDEIGSGLIRDLYDRAHNKERFRDTPLTGRIPTRVFQRPVGRFYKPETIRLVEKTPANSLRIPMLAQAFPDASFLYIVRRGEAVVSSLMEGWKNWSGTADGEDWRYTKWHYLVPPGWRSWTGRPLEEICTYQWVASNLAARFDLERWAPKRFLILRYEDLIATPSEDYQNIAQFCGLRRSESFGRVVAGATDRVFATGGSRPQSEKWKQLHYTEIMRMRHVIEPLNERYYRDPEVK